jgi:S1-C subfamily serine protease
MRSFRTAVRSVCARPALLRRELTGVSLQQHSTHSHGRSGDRSGGALLALGFAAACAAVGAAPAGGVHADSSPGSAAGRPLSRTFVADAAAIAAPSVVNISSISGGGLFMTGSAGSGFIITEVRTQ